MVVSRWEDSPTLLVLDYDLFGIPAEQILQTNVDYAVVGGWFV